MAGVFFFFTAFCYGLDLAWTLSSWSNGPIEILGGVGMAAARGDKLLLLGAAGPAAEAVCCFFFVNGLIEFREKI